MAEMTVLHEATVGADEIDHLGHMNVRFYLEKALLASRALAAQHGLSPELCRDLGAVLELRETFTRHYREQLEGARLVVMGGVLALESDRIRLYHELSNTQTGERAATFVHELSLRKRGSQELLPLPEMLARSAADELVDWPEHGRPRTLDLARVPDSISLATARDRGLAMRRERELVAEECDDEGFFIASNYQDLLWGGRPVDEREPGMPIFEMEDGGKFGWATLESRGALRRLPRVGDTIQSFGAEVQLAAKTSTRHGWVFDVSSGDLLCTSSIVNLAFDIDARRAIPIPARIRETLEAEFHPDLR